MDGTDQFSGRNIMKTIPLLSVSLLILTGALPAARADECRTDINPALQYFQSFLVAPPPMAAADMDYFNSKEGRSKQLPDRFGGIVAGYDNQFRLLHQAAHATVPCDWGLDFCVGVNAFLPHLARAKAATQAAQVRAVWELQHGQPAAAREDLAAVFVLARNASRDDTIIGTMVEFANEAIINATIAQNFGQFPPETLQGLADDFAAAPPAGILATSIPGEKKYVHDWLMEKILKTQQLYPGDDRKVMAMIRPEYELIRNSQTFFAGKEDTNLWSRIVTAAGGTSDGVLNLLRDNGPLYARLATLMALPAGEFKPQAEAFNAEIKGSTNPLTQVLFPFPNIRRSREFRSQANGAMVRAAMEYKLHGDAGLQSVSDPFGHGPFHCERFVFKGVDRGFKLTSAYDGLGYPCAMIFVEKTGPAFVIEGPHLGEAVTQ
jgi:hypothetical protein